MKPEARLWQTMKTNMWMPGDRLDRIENCAGSGQPDVNGCLSGEDVWVELKAPKAPVRATTPLLSSNSNHPLLISQINWFARQRQAGGIAFILLRTQSHLILVDGTKHGDTINSMPLKDVLASSVFYTSVPTKKDDWRLLRNVIFTASRHRRLHHHKSAELMLADLERKQG